MKVRYLVTPNIKGQIVIPKKIRSALKITPQTPLNIQIRGEGAYLFPVRGVISSTQKQSTYLDLLKKTQGAWQASNWASVRKKRKQIELTAAKKRRQQW